MTQLYPRVTAACGLGEISAVRQASDSGLEQHLSGVGAAITGADTGIAP